MDNNCRSDNYNCSIQNSINVFDDESEDEPCLGGFKRLR